MKSFPEVSVLNTRFHKVTVHQLIQYLVSAAKTETKKVVGNVNIRAMNFAYELPWYRDFINDADLVFCDGFGVILGAKFCGCSLDSTHRMTCPDYIEDLVKGCEKNNVSLFILAGRPGVVEKAIDKFNVIAPNLKVEGHHGYFEKSGAENDAVIQKINEFQPGILYIGFGMPLQERWIVENFDRIEARIFLPLGACLDFYTDTVNRGPSWLTDNGFEWLSRFITEPRRLWKRYFLGNLVFFYRVFCSKLFNLQKRKKRLQPKG